MKKGPKKKALAYLRRSNGANDSASEKRQREAIDRAAAHAGYVIEEDGYYFDAKISGASELEDRPALQKLFAILEDGDYDTIFCEAIDRIARSTLCGQVLCNQLKEMGVTAYDSFGKNLTTSTDGEQNLIRDIMLCIASYEREKIVARMLHGRKRKKKDLKAKARKNNRISTKVEQAIIKKIKNLRKSKSKKHSTWGGIASALNVAGITNRAGNPWRMANVRKIGMANGLN